MLKTYFGDLADGRLLRQSYLGYSVLLQFIGLACFIAIALTIGPGEQFAGGDLEQTQAQLAENLSTPLLMIVALLVAGTLFANLNITAKRIRDTGLPGWLTVGALLLLSLLISIFLSPEVASSFHVLYWIALLFIPSNSFSSD